MEKIKNDKENFLEGLHDGIPIALGYFAVAFSLGINAASAGLNAFQGFLASLLTKASAGEYAAYGVISSDAPYIEMVLVILVANARYFLMSCSLGTRISPDIKSIHRFLLGFCITDEVFAISSARPKYLNPFYTYGAILVASLCWAGGTSCGIVAGNIMPKIIVNSFSVALYGMFIAVVVPPCRKEKKILFIVLVSFALSFVCSKINYVARISGGIRTIILTVIISACAAVMFPVKLEDEGELNDEA